MECGHQGGNEGCCSHLRVGPKVGRSRSTCPVCARHKVTEMLKVQPKPLWGSWPCKKDGGGKNHPPLLSHGDRPVQRKSLFCWVLMAGQVDKATGRGRTSGLVGDREWGGERHQQRHRGGKGWYAPGTTEHQCWPGRDGECLARGSKSVVFFFSFLMT